MGGVLGIFEEQAIVIPLPGEDSKAVRTFVSTTNKVLYNMRKLFCEKNTGDERSVAVAIFEYMLFNVKNSRVDLQECLSPQFLEENIKKDWEEATKSPLYIDASENMKKVMKDIFFDTANGIREFGEAACTGGPTDNKASHMTKKDFYKLVQDLYDALCPDHKYTLKPVDLTEENMPQLMLSLFTMALMTMASVAPEAEPETTQVSPSPQGTDTDVPTLDTGGNTVDTVSIPPPP